MTTPNRQSHPADCVVPARSKTLDSPWGRLVSRSEACKARVCVRNPLRVRSKWGPESESGHRRPHQPDHCPSKTICSAISGHLSSLPKRLIHPTVVLANTSSRNYISFSSQVAFVSVIVIVIVTERPWSETVLRPPTHPVFSAARLHIMELLDKHKEKRKVTACVRCNRRKVRCDIDWQNPPCTACRRHGESCKMPDRGPSR